VSRVLAVVLFVAGIVLAAQEYAGPRPPQKDTVYLVHANNLVEAETSMARRKTTGADIIYVVPGERSLARTPLASPTLIIESARVDAESLRLFRLEVKDGHREIGFHYKSKGGAVPLRADITRISGDLFQIEVLDSLSVGEYALSPDGANDVFCFEVF
jgi:hypothetical protein